MPFSFYKTRRLRFIFIVYWFLLTYIIAALVWWFIALNQQNKQMADLATSQLKAGDAQYTHDLNDIANLKKRKTAQYIGEGSIFFTAHFIRGSFYLSHGEAAV